MTISTFVASIKAATPDTPAIVRLEIWENGIGTAPPPEEITVSLFPVDGPVVVPPPPDQTLYALANTNVRAAPSVSALLFAKNSVLATGQKVIVTGFVTETNSIGDKHFWRQINADGPYAGGWVATDVLSTAPPK